MANFYHFAGILILTISASYAVFTLAVAYFWKKLPSSPDQENGTRPFISVIIPVRNESENILNLLQDLASQNIGGDHFEVLVVDDSSGDNTREIVRSFADTATIEVKLIELEYVATDSPKKRAIETAIGIARGNLIVTTDGDCRVKPGWLGAFADSYTTTTARVISGPVTFLSPQSVPDHLQTVEFASLIGSGASAISAGFPSLCNGANLCYEKQAFLDVRGFEGVRHIASGDDEFLMHKISAAFPGSVTFLKNADAVVKTLPHQQWKQFYRQRKRWASKWKHYQSKVPLTLALYIFSCNLTCIAALALGLTGAIPSFIAVTALVLKWIPEWYFLSMVLRFLEQHRSVKYIPVTQLFYPFYVCFFGLAVQQPTYEWKGRKLK